MKPDEIWRIAAAAWRGTLQLVPRMPVLFGSAFLLFAIIEMGVRAMPVDASGSDDQGFSELYFSVIDPVLTAVVVASLAVAVQRWVLLGEATDRIAFGLGQRSLRFALWLIVLNVLFYWTDQACIHWTDRVFTGLPVGEYLSIFFRQAARLAVALVTVRVILLFPAIAVDAETSPRRAWNLSRGLIWPMSATYVIAVLPLYIAAWLVWASGIVRGAYVDPSQAVTIFIYALTTVMTTCLVAAIAAQYYKTGSRLAPTPDNYTKTWEAE